MSTPTAEALDGLSALQEHAPAITAALAKLTLAPGVTLRPLDSFALQADIVPLGAAASDEGNLGKLARIQAALVGLAWTGPGKPKAKYQGDPLTYGGAVLDDLIGRGVSFGDIASAGGMLLILAAAGFASRAGVMERARERADFTGPPPVL